MRWRIAFAWVLLASGCTRFPYSGDGQLSGPYLYGGQYALDLGPIDLTRSGSSTYHLDKLPGKGWVIGVQMVEAAPNPTFGNPPSHPARIRIRVESPSGNVVLREEGRVDRFVWNHGVGDRSSYYYSTERFDPWPDALSLVFVDVIEPDITSCCGATVLAQSTN